MVTMSVALTDQQVRSDLGIAIEKRNIYLIS
jgi:hypothetical protein